MKTTMNFTKRDMEIADKLKKKFDYRSLTQVVSNSLAIAEEAIDKIFKW